MKLKIFIFIILSIVLTSCGTQKRASILKKGGVGYEVDEDSSKTTVAILLPLNGGRNSLGKSMLQAAQMALHENNNPAIKLDVIDTEANDYSARDVVLKARMRNVRLMLGPVFYKNAKEIAPLARAQGINLISFSNNMNLKGTGAFVFGLIPEQQTQRMIVYARNHGINKIYALIPSNKYGLAMQETIRKLADEEEHFGIKLGSIQFYGNEPNGYERALKVLLDTIKASRNVKVGLFVPEAGKYLPDLSNGLISSHISHKIQLLGSSQWDNINTLKHPELAGAWIIKNKTIEYNEFEREYKTLYGHKPKQVASLAYDGVSIANTIAAKNGSFSFNEITHTDGFNGINGRVTFDASGLSIHSLPIAEIGDGNFEIIQESTHSMKP